MNTQEITLLRESLKVSAVLWQFDENSAAARVNRIGPPPGWQAGHTCDQDECAFLANGAFVPLGSATIAQFSTQAPLLLGATQAKNSERWVHGVEHGFPSCGRQIHPHVGEPYWYMGSLMDNPARFKAAEAAIDARIALVALATGAPGSSVPQGAAHASVNHESQGFKGLMGHGVMEAS